MARREWRYAMKAAAIVRRHALYADDADAAIRYAAAAFDADAFFFFHTFFRFISSRLSSLFFA